MTQPNPDMYTEEELNAKTVEELKEFARVYGFKFERFYTKDIMIDIIISYHLSRKYIQLFSDFEKGIFSESEKYTKEELSSKTIEQLKQIASSHGFRFSSNCRKGDMIGFMLLKCVQRNIVRTFLPKSEAKTIWLHRMRERNKSMDTPQNTTPEVPTPEVPKPEVPKPEVPKPEVPKKTTKTVIFRKSQFGNFCFEGFVFNKQGRCVCGKEMSDGTIAPLTQEDKEIVKSYKLKCE